MKLDLILNDAITLFEGVKIGGAAIKRALASADNLFQMGFEVEFVFGGLDEDLPLKNLKPNDFGKYFEFSEYDTDELYQYLSDNQEKFIDRDDLEDEFMSNHLEKDWYKDWLDENGYLDEDDPTPKEDWPDEDDAKEEIKDGLGDEIQTYVDEHLETIEQNDIAEVWIKADPGGFIDAMQWEMNYDYDIDYYGDIIHREPSVDDVGQELEYMFPDDEVEPLGEYTGDKTTHDKWYVEPDSSLTKGLEIVSPIKPVSESLDDLEKVFEWIDDKGHDTSTETGLHISLSFIDNATPEMDWVKLAVLMGEKYMLKEFERANNNFTTSQLSRVKGIIKDEDLQGFTSWEGYKDLQSKLTLGMNDRESSFNVSEFHKNGRVEFRIMGNEDYHKDFKKVKNGVGRYVMFMEIARDPELYKKEYMRKLGKLFAGKREDPLEQNVDHMEETSRVDKKWVRALLAAFGSLPTDAIEQLRKVLAQRDVFQQHQNDDGEAKGYLRNGFFALVSYALAPIATKFIKTDATTLVTESTSFITYLIEKKSTSQLDKMKLVVRKLAQHVGMTDDDFKTRFHNSPTDAASRMRPEYDNIQNDQVVAVLAYPETDAVVKKVFARTQEILGLGNKLKDENTKRLFIEMLGMLDSRGMVNQNRVTTGLKELVFRLYDDPIKNDPKLKKLIKTMLVNSERRGFHVLQAVAEEYPNDTQRTDDFLKFAFGLVGRHVPKEYQQQSPEVKQHDQRKQQRVRDNELRTQQMTQRSDQRQDQYQQRVARERQAQQQQAVRDPNNVAY